MSNLFQYTKTDEQGWLVGKPEIPAPSSEDTDWYFNEYREHINSLRRFKYDYPDPGKEMELGKDFEVMDTNKWYYCKCEQCGWEGSSEHCGGGHQIADTGDYHDAVCPKCYSTRLDGQPLIDVPQYEGTIAIPITQRTYSEQDLLDTWDVSKVDIISKEDFFKKKFNIEIK